MVTGAETFTLTDAERAMLPSAADVEFYAIHGWYVSPKLLSDAEVDELAAASNRFYAGERTRSLPCRPPRLSYWTPEAGQVQRANDYVHYESDAVAEILRRPIIGAVAARLAGVEEIRVFQSTLILKPPAPDEPTNLVPWHFDRDYWATSSSELMLTAFIPFHDCDERMGTITMIDQSHRWHDGDDADVTARHFADLRSDGEEALHRRARANGSAVRKVPMVLAKGQMSFHHCRTYHGSGPNRSSDPRRAISLHLQNGENAYRHFAIGDGSTATYNHDALVRRNSMGDPDYADPNFCPVIWRGELQ